MKKTVSCIALALAAGIAFANEVSPLEASIAKGAKYLLANQQADGHFSDAQMPALTALPLWALSGCGDTSETVVEAKKKAAKFVLGTQREDGGFYVPKPGAPLLKAREYIASSQLTGDDTMAGGFGYDKISRRRYADLSNTSYALSAMAKTASLEEFREGGKRVDLDWDKALAFVDNLMKKDGPDAGGAAYNDRTPQGGTETNAQGKVALRAYGAMTYAAVLSMCSAKLDKGDPRVRQSVEWMERNWSVDENPGMGNQGLYYFYDIMTRALDAAKIGKVGEHDWKKEISAKIVSLQREDGSWANENNRFWESDPVLCTSFALLALELCR